MAYIFKYYGDVKCGEFKGLGVGFSITLCFKDEDSELSCNMHESKAINQVDY